MERVPLKRNSKGPGLRLSWPKASDGRRAIVGKPQSFAPSHGRGTRYSSEVGMVHVSHGDVEMHYQFASSVPSGSARPHLHIPMAWNPSKVEVEDKDLLQYFQSVASQSLATFGHDPTDLGKVLIRIALASNTTSATAVLHSLLAFSSLHRHDVHSQAAELKISAIKAMAAASGSRPGITEAIQHVAAGMLLCSFEIHQSSCTSSQWTWYLCGVKCMIKSAGLDKIREDSDLAALLDWVYYHDVLARFTLRHWHREGTVVTSTPSIRAEASHAAPPALATIELLSEVCDAVSARPPATKPAEDLNDYRSYLKILDWRIRSLPLAATVDNNADTPLIMELYQLAMLVYLNRASENSLKQATRTQQQIDKAFTIFSQLGSCDRQFPVFILGCEARRDDQRAVVLDLISRTEKNVSSRSFNYVKILMQAIWAQDDLADRDINYWDKLSYVISCCSIVPTFV
ncbi:uncharacterized protein BDZ99DRAFT_524490 [Mytilinidion resinicola]|uniref:Fungal-specific transcription factor domain-containing protein n=1 Tax=Mytilinidion resinicola TaxID=574789 RepID=A0A6A6Y9M7_9PEZI|nr:uncharacterized protein BDZ99DRAFT_524490 [Mytilinidion resinicola]KAF2805521.1 hypothetical protein BDZ99DRAFT_524490 [Mytilinidion resinicola]